MRAALIGAMAAVLLLPAGMAPAQDEVPGTMGAEREAFCYLTEIKVDELSNAVRVTLQADGTLTPEIDPEQFYQREPGTEGGPRRFRSLRFRLPYTRSRVGSFYDVASYPVSHVGLSIPRESRAGVGLDVEVVLYRGALIRSIELPNWHSWSTYGSMSGPFVKLAMSRDNRSIIITVLRSRYREVAEERAEELIRRRTVLDVSTDDEGRLTVRALNADLHKLVEEVATAAGIRAAVSDDVTRKASMYLEHQDVQALMRSIARAYGLGLDHREGLYLITSGIPESVQAYGGSASAAFRVQHMRADDALELLPDFLLRYVSVDTARNALVMTGPPELLAKLSETLHKVDLPQPQIELRVLIIESVAEGSLSRFLEYLVADGTTEAHVHSGTGDLTVHVVNQPLDELWAAVRSLRGKGLIRTRLEPTVIVRNCETGTVFSGQTHYFPFLERGSGRGGQEISLRSVEVGTSIWTEAWTGGDVINLSLWIQGNSIVGVDQEGLPLIATRRANSTVRVADGDTIVLAGLSALTQDAERRRTPGIGEAPLLDVALGAEESGWHQTELLVLLEARIARQPAPVLGPGGRPNESTEATEAPLVPSPYPLPRGEGRVRAVVSPATQMSGESL